MRAISFTKMHGLGNDFVVIDDLTRPDGALTPIDPGLARRLCDRRFGVGADQLLRICPQQLPDSDVRMEIWNADGSVAEMCGNGIRAVGLYLTKHAADRFPGKRSFKIETLAGIKFIEVRDENHIRVDMGVPQVGSEEILAVAKGLSFIPVDIGNPHAVIFVDHLKDIPIADWGPKIESHPQFPNRTNVEFVEVLSPSHLRVGVWERGGGETLACGTGACAVAAAALQSGRANAKDLRITLPGGDLMISWEGAGTPIWMEGPAVEVFRGVFFA